MTKRRRKNDGIKRKLKKRKMRGRERRKNDENYEEKKGNGKMKEKI